MPVALATREDIVERLFAVFRDRGFDGASLADLSRATGLGKSSLYHHFPDGKTGMAQAVLERAHAVLTEGVGDAARSAAPLATRLRRIVALFDQMYAGGRASCVLAQLSTADIGEDARAELRAAFAQWIGGVEALARESGMAAPRARTFAEDWVAQVQGALILQSALGDAAPFRRALDLLLDLAPAGATRG